MIFPLNLHLQMIFLLKPHLQTIFPLKPPFADDFPCIFRGLAMKKHVNDPGVTPRRSKLEGSIRCFGNLEPSFSRLNPAASRSRLVDVAVRPKHPMASNGYPRKGPNPE
ncbi:unnamed protein product [Cladocopium goreaui]|uniref:Uncharacterized protein n=1 Tax=Cladocopium goreaui TaxID=2562237 RepID=A0A9P1FTH7_9DINO|nr:unnamed protein product [Cladocopium goreaui]